MLPYQNSRNHVVDQCRSKLDGSCYGPPYPNICPDELLWVNMYPSIILVAEDANAHANSTCSHQKFYMFMGINIPPVSKFYVCGIPCCCGLMQFHFVVMGQHASHDHVCHHAPPHPNFQMHACGLISIQVNTFSLGCNANAHSVFLGPGR